MGQNYKVGGQDTINNIIILIMTRRSLFITDVNANEAEHIEMQSCGAYEAIRLGHQSHTDRGVCTDDHPGILAH